jgi:hypothetical protein
MNDDLYDSFIQDGSHFMMNKTLPVLRGWTIAMADEPTSNL